MREERAGFWNLENAAGGKGERGTNREAQYERGGNGEQWMGIG